MNPICSIVIVLRLGLDTLVNKCSTMANLELTKDGFSKGWRCWVLVGVNGGKWANDVVKHQNLHKLQYNIK